MAGLASRTWIRSPLKSQLCWFKPILRVTMAPVQSRDESGPGMGQSYHTWSTCPMKCACEWHHICGDMTINMKPTEAASVAVVSVPGACTSEQYIDSRCMYQTTASPVLDVVQLGVWSFKLPITLLRPITFHGQAIISAIVVCQHEISIFNSGAGYLCRSSHWIWPDSRL